MTIIDWINRRLPADHARHLILCALIALAAAKLSPLIGLAPWLAALASAFAVSFAWEWWQRKTNTGHASWNDVGAGLSGGILIALAVA